VDGSKVGVTEGMGVAVKVVVGVGVTILVGKRVGVCVGEFVAGRMLASGVGVGGFKDAEGLPHPAVTARVREMAIHVRRVGIGEVYYSVAG